MIQFLKQFFAKRSLRELEETVRLINAIEPELSALSDIALRDESKKLREKITELPERINDEAFIARGFALVREAAQRTLGQRPYDVQLMGGLALHNGGVSEMATGEGKTLAAVAPTYLNALLGKGVHVVTVNEYLARRDAVWMGQIYHALGLSVACLVPERAFLYDPKYEAEVDSPKESALLDKERDTTGSFLVQQEFLRPISRREGYLADVTYGTNHEFGFDYLRDNLSYGLQTQVQRGHHYAIIDEVDSILIDEARTPLIISAPDVESSEYYKTFARVASGLELETDYVVDEKVRSVSITESGIEKVEKKLGIQNLYAPEQLRLVHYLEESLKAKALYKKDKDYVVKDGEILIVDEFTGRILQGRRYNGGLHQAIEAKEGVQVKQESRTYGKISIQNYFRMYAKVAGMTGTAQTSAEEFHKVYGLDVVTIPSNRPNVRSDASDVIYKNIDAKWGAVVREVKEKYEKGQPVLLGTASIAKNELISSLLSREGIPHELLNAKNNEREGAIVAQAGRAKAITVATNLAGRGVDIILGGNPPDAEEAKRVRELGGLHVIGTDRHDARRIDNQLRGRAGRQGDPGSSQFFLSLEDDLLRIFGGDRIKTMMDRFKLPENEPIQIGFLSRAIQEAQSRVEGANFDMRKHLLDYDDVLNKQRSAVYKRRQEIMESMNKDALGNIIFESAKSQLMAIEESNIAIDQSGNPQAIDWEKTLNEAGILEKENGKGKTENVDNQEDRMSLLVKRSMEVSMDPQTIPRLLGLIDMLWMNHLEDLEALSESVGLRAYAQKDPLVEYRGEAHRLFKDFWANFNGWVFSNIFKLAAQNAMSFSQDARAAQPRQIVQASSVTTKDYGLSPNGSKIGRNDPCHCGSGKKYKRCHGYS